MDFDLEKRDNLLKEELAKNEAETIRWEIFEQENKQATENMEMFLKKLNVEVLVPIAGNKAFMPGCLYHTNEILVGHYNGMFSKCSTSKAQEIAKYRLKLAKERLEALRKEKEMFENKLNVPHTDGILPSENQKEIIEEYDEEKEKIWHEEHKKRVREHKQRVRQSEKVVNEKTHEDIMSVLDELELIEELDQELENLEIEDSDMVRKLMSGEIKLPPEKRRISHGNKNSDVIVGSNNDSEEKNTNSKHKSDELYVDSLMEEVYNKYKTEKLTENQQNNDFTNNNIIPNTEDFEREENVDDPDSDDDDDNDDNYEEFDKIKKETEHMSVKEKIKFYKMKIKEVEKNVRELKITNVYEYNEKLNLLEFLDYLNDEVELLKDEQDNCGIEEFVSNRNIEKKPTKKISFALEDDIHFIDKDKTVEESMMKENKGERDIIVLDSDVFPKKSEKNYEQQTAAKKIIVSDNVAIDRKTSVLNEVEKSRNFVFESQSQQDFDLIGKILESSESKTLLIKYDHSEKKFYYPGYESNDEETNIIGSPADIYKFYGKNNGISCSDSSQLETSFKKSYVVQKSDNEISNKISDENANIKVQNVPNKIFEGVKQNVGSINNASDLKLKNQISDNKVDKPLDDEQKKQQSKTKSILKNKDAVKLETHVTETKSKKKRSNKNKEELNHFNMIVGDIVENPSLEHGPEPLPNGNFVDTHAPKKRVSRFKQMRDTLRTKS